MIIICLCRSTLSRRIHSNFKYSRVLYTLILMRPFSKVEIWIMVRMTHHWFNDISSSYWIADLLLLISIFCIAWLWLLSAWVSTYLVVSSFEHQYSRVQNSPWWDPLALTGYEIWIMVSLTHQNDFVYDIYTFIEFIRTRIYAKFNTICMRPWLARSKSVSC